MVDSKAATEVSYLPIVTASGGADKVLQVSVILNEAAQLHNNGPDWDAVVGVAQFHITSKEFTKFDVNVEGGFFGVNVNGALYTSNTTAQLKVLYGLSLHSLTPGKAASLFKSSELDEMIPTAEWKNWGDRVQRHL